MVIILLMSLLTNSNICVNSGSVLIDYSSIMGHNFLLLCLPDNFDWMLDFMNFTLMDAGYFCVTVNILTLLYVTQLNSLGTV